MKKILAILLVAVMAVSFVACSGGEVNTGSEITETSSETTTTSAEEVSGTVSVNPTTTSAKPSSSSKPQSSSSAARPSSSKKPSSTYVPPVNSTVTPPPSYSGTYLEDTTVASLSWSYESLKADLEGYIAANNPTSTASYGDTYDLTSNFKKYSVLGYYADNGAKLSASVSTDANKNLQSFTCSITIACKDWSAVESAFKADYNKLKTFAGNEPTIYIVPASGNPAPYGSIAQLPAERVQKIYKGSGGEHLNIKVEDAGFAKAQFSVKCTRENNVLMFTSTFTATYK